MTSWRAGAKRILVVDDDSTDLDLARYAFEEAGFDPDLLDTAESGLEALDYLCRRGRHADRVTPTPSLVLMDVNMPRMDGIATLQQIKSNPALQMVPVVMLTTSDAVQDMEDSYRHGANGYVIKPTQLPAFIDVLMTLRAFWLQTNAMVLPRTLPNCSGTGR